MVGCRVRVRVEVRYILVSVGDEVPVGKRVDVSETVAVGVDVGSVAVGVGVDTVGVMVEVGTVGVIVGVGTVGVGVVGQVVPGPGWATWIVPFST